MTITGKKSAIARFVSTLAVICVMVVFPGCAMWKDQPSGSADKVTRSSEALVQEAASKLQSGHRQGSLSLLRQAARQDPVAITPWLRIAQLQFDADAYGQAIVAAEEVLRRKPANRTANSIITVSGLRIAAKSILELRAHEGLKGTVRSQAEDLAHQLRDTLGEQSLLNVPQTRTRRRAARKSMSRVIQSKPQSTKSAQPTRQAKQSDGDGTNPFNPFASLQTLPQ